MQSKMKQELNLLKETTAQTGFAKPKTSPDRRQPCLVLRERDSQSQSQLKRCSVGVGEGKDRIDRVVSADFQRDCY